MTLRSFERKVLMGSMTHHAVVDVLRDDADPDGRYLVTVRIGDKEFSGQSGDAFAALAACRRQFEPDGIRLLVEGSRRGSYPSGMLRDMAGGMTLYREIPGMKPSPSDTVKTFDPAEDDIVTVDEQRAAHDAWVNSFAR